TAAGERRGDGDHCGEHCDGDDAAAKAHFHLLVRFCESRPMLLPRRRRNVEIASQRCLARRMEFAVLGPIEVRIAGRTLPLGGPKQRALVALLLLNANEAVARDRLVDELWGERAPASAQRSLDTYVYRLRTLLGSDRIERPPPGYLLHLEPGELDLARFELL